MATMKLTAPTPRRRVFCDKEAPFPVPTETVTGQPPTGDKWCYFSGDLVDNHVVVRHSGDMDVLYRMGFFGKASLSRFRPEYNHGFWGVRKQRRAEGKKDAALRVTSRRSYLRHVAWSKPSDERTETDDDLEIRPLARKQPKLPAKCQAMSDVSVDVEENECQTNSSREPDISKAEQCSRETLLDASTEKWPTTEDDPWETGDKQEAMDFWGVTDNSTGNDITSCKAGGIFSKDQDSQSSSEKTAFEEDSVALVKSQTDKSKITTDSRFLGISMDLHKVDQLRTLNQGNRDTHPQQSNKPNLEKQSCDFKSEQCDDVKPLSQPEITPTGNDNVKNGNNDDVIKEKEMDYDPLCLENDELADLYVVDDTDDSDEEVDAEEKSWRPVCKREPHALNETLLLTFEEAFFLSYGLGCLVVLDEDKHPMTLTEMWQTFLSRQPNFVPQYIAYHYIRSRGWVPKEALKFGVHYLVYKHGPAFYHSSFAVVVQLVSEADLHTNCPLSPTTQWRSLMGLSRTTEGIGKEVMFCYVIQPSRLAEEDLQSPKCIKEFKVKEVVMRRWVSQQEREASAADKDVF